MTQFQHRLVAVGAAVSVALLAVTPSAAQDADVPAVPAVAAARVPADLDVSVDGLLEEDAWALAHPITELRQQEPVEGDTPSEPSDIRILHDGEALYIGAKLFESDPSGILAHQLARDAGLGTDDRFMWILDTFQDGRTGYSPTR